MAKISYLDLQKKYPKQLVALNKGETQVLAVGEKLSDLVRRLKSRKINPQTCVFVGPVQKYGTVSIYVSLRAQTN